MKIHKNLDAIINSIPNDVKLVAVSKTKPIDQIKLAYDFGQKDFGENKVQELVNKYNSLNKDIKWHMIGHLQRNKVKFIAPFIHLIHSVDSYRLLKEINKQGYKCNRLINILVQIDISNDNSKFGFSYNGLFQIFELLHPSRDVLCQVLPRLSIFHTYQLMILIISLIVFFILIYCMIYTFPQIIITSIKS